MPIWYVLESLVTPSLEEAIVASIKAQIARIRVALPARVQSYDATTQQVDLQLLVMEARADEFGNRVAAPLAMLANVPVRFDGSGDYGSTYPISVGDTGLAVFCSSSIDRGLHGGGDLVDPELDWHHHLSDAVFHPGLSDYQHAIPDVATDAYVVRSPTEIRLGSSSASDAAVAQSALDDFMSALASALASLGASPAAPALAALQTKLLALNSSAGWQARTSKVKVE